MHVEQRPLVKPRRVTEERIEETRQRLLDAAIDCLVEKGYARTTTVEIARRAGFTRGAQLHHFGNRDELILAAVEHLGMRRLAEFNELMRDPPRSRSEDDAAIDFVWESSRSRVQIAWLELSVAARTDEKLRQKVSQFGRRYYENVLNAGRRFTQKKNSAELQVMFAFIFSVTSGRLVETLPYEKEGPARVPDEKIAGLLKEFLSMWDKVPHQLKRF